VQTKLNTAACEYVQILVSRFCLYPSHSDKQHIRHCIALGGELYPRPEMVDFILRPETGVEKKILDIGQYLVSVPRKPD
jgi:hypothetical protein